MPAGFYTAVEDAVRETLRQGLYGWQVTDCAVTITHSAPPAREARAADCRNLTPLVLMSALEQAGTVVCEPIHRFRLEFPADLLGRVLPALARLGAVPQAPGCAARRARSRARSPRRACTSCSSSCAALTRGEGVLESAFDRYEPVGGALPTRPRSDGNPLNREEYLLAPREAVLAMGGTRKMHADELDIDVALVGRLLAAQFPQWASLPVEPVASSGTVNAIYRLGDDMAVRLPRVETWAGDLEKELEWLPRLAPHLPLAVPEPVAAGAPGEGYPWRWAVYRWLEGETWAADRVADLRGAATELARFVAALQRIDGEGGPSGGRGGRGSAARGARRRRPRGDRSLAAASSTRTRSRPRGRPRSRPRSGTARPS